MIMKSWDRDAELTINTLDVRPHACVKFSDPDLILEIATKSNVRDRGFRAVHGNVGA